MTSLRRIVVSALFLLICLPAIADNVSSPQVRVKLARFFPPLTQTITVTSAEGYTISDQTGTPLVQAAAGSTYQITNAPNAQVSVSAPGVMPDDEESETGAASGTQYLTIHGTGETPIGVAIASSTNPVHYYRGDIVVSPGLSLVDILPLEQYLNGVLLPEIGGRAPLEALKAQAVASRTYTLRNLGKLSVSNADMDDTTRTQSYLGVAGETPNITQAVADTSGQVIIYQAALIDAVFSTDCGGETADGGPGFPYLASVKDPECGGDQSWNYELTQQNELLLLGTLAAADGKPITLTISSRDRSGRVTSLIVSQGTARQTMNGDQLRKILGYDFVKSTLFKLKPHADGTYTIQGKGWGHGLGLCQHGAIFLAQHGSLYTGILQHYYTGTDIVQLDPSLLVKPQNNLVIEEPTTPESSQPGL